MSRRKLKTIREIATWLRETSNYVWEKDEACMAWFYVDPADHDLVLALGWLPGYDPKDADDGYMMSRSNPTWGLNAALVLLNPWDCADLEFATMPWCRKDGEVWNTELTMRKDDDWSSNAKWFRKEYEAMCRERRKGEKSEYVFDYRERG